MVSANLQIINPKRTNQAESEWESFFPYYAGYPESFASSVLTSADLPTNSLIFDPWNGSGTTTCAASSLGFRSIGFDLNPAMIVIGRARLISPSDADSLVPICRSILSCHKTCEAALPDDPLLMWFGQETTNHIRSLEQAICTQLVGPWTISDCGLKLENLSGVAAVFYVALFSVCRSAGLRFRSTNPTWFRHTKPGERRVSISRPRLHALVLDFITRMSDALHRRNDHGGESTIRLTDSTTSVLEPDSVDFVLTSPPYCTRIDYSAATRIELAVLSRIVGSSSSDIRRKMLGSIKVPANNIEPNASWGQTCTGFLERLRGHASKASATYYYKTHLDYFHKYSRSITGFAKSLKVGGIAVLVVQDSYYKDIHNDLTKITEEMASQASLTLKRREDFFSVRSMSGINGRSRSYARPLGATESVLCFQKN